MANLGTDPDLERELFCEGCRAGTTHPGKVISYDRPEVLRLRATGEVEHGERCVHCGAPMKPEATEAPAVQSAPAPSASPPARRRSGGDA